MKKFQAARLIKLVNFLRDVPRRDFFFGCFADIRDCGTVACALGWAGLMPEFREAGLKTNVKYNEVLFERKTKGGWDTFEDCYAAQEFFGLTRDESLGIFLPGFQNEIGSRQLTDGASPTSVIKNIVKVVKMNDFDVVEKNGYYELK